LNETEFFIKWKENLFLGYVQVYPDKGTVAFSAGLHGWGFSLTNFANMYASKLWGENFFDPATKRWTTKRTSFATCKLGFLWPMLQNLGVTTKNDEKDLIGKPLMKRVMLTWGTVSRTCTWVLSMISVPIRNCDPEGLLTLYVSKMIPCTRQGLFFAFGHVFVGEVATGAKVRIMGVSRERLVQQECPENCGWEGNRGLLRMYLVVAQLPWLDWIITKIATLTNKKEVDAHPIRAKKFSVSPILVEELTRLSNSDPMVVCTCWRTHLEICLKDLQDDIMGEKSSGTVMSQSPNKHNRLYLEARPFEGGLAEAIDDGRIGPRDDPKGKDLAKKIWCFGPDTTGPNMVVDMCEGVQYLSEIKESVVAGSQWIKGRCAGRREHERLFLVDIKAPKNALGGIYGVLNQKRGHVFEKVQRPGTPLYNMKAYLLVVESFGFSAQLRSATSGEAFPPSVFDHWDTMMADLLHPGTQAAHLVTDIRKRKSLKSQM
ncbi:hypothetical protein MKX03_013802, partial [Papaver bracteatum]